MANTDLLIAKVIRNQFTKLTGLEIPLADKTAVVLSALASASSMKNADFRENVIKYILSKSNSL
jgi:hypothetical protein